MLVFQESEVPPSIYSREWLSLGWEEKRCAALRIVIDISNILTLPLYNRLLGRTADLEKLDLYIRIHLVLHITHHRRLGAHTNSFVVDIDATSAGRID